MTADLADHIAGGVTGKGAHPLDRFTHKIITNILHSVAIPWLTSCIMKYDESFFHMRMADPNWDYIYDWETNHYSMYHKFINGARRLRHRFHFDIDEVTDLVVYAIQSHGWTVFLQERDKLRSTVERVRADIYA